MSSGFWGWNFGSWILGLSLWKKMGMVILELVWLGMRSGVWDTDLQVQSSRGARISFLERKNTIRATRTNPSELVLNPSHTSPTHHPKIQPCSLFSTPHTPLQLIIQNLSLAPCSLCGIEVEERRQTTDDRRKTGTGLGTETETERD